MKVLVACEFSGRVRDAFAALGHDATSCDILPSETPGKHYQGSVLDILGDGWDLMIAHPPCTHLAVSGARVFEEKRKDGRQQEAIDFFMKLINAPIPKIAVENPVCIMSTIYRKPDQIIHPYYFGDNVPKKTCLWLKNLAPLYWSKTDTLFDKKTLVQPKYVLYSSAKNKSGKSRYGVAWGPRKGMNRKSERHKTFPGIAKAMAEQWG